MITMFVQRPYVFAFLAAFLALSIRRWGWQRSLLWLVTGYIIALASEACSIRTGFPYGWYFYQYDNLTHDPLVFGVPFWDSLSYPFLIYAGYSVARWRWPNTTPLRLALFGATFTMLLDVIIDPIAHLGAQWFLGEIYYYEHPGWYFDVPISNFAGWFLVSLCVIRCNQRLWRTSDNSASSKLDLAFYASIALFNILITWWIGAWQLGLCSSGILLAIALVIARRPRADEVIQHVESNVGLLRERSAPPRNDTMHEKEIL